MLKKTHIIFTLSLALVFVGCSPADPNEQIEAGHLTESSYTYEGIGWSMQIPAGWTILSSKEVNRHEDKGKELLTETIGEDIGFEGLKNLLHFQKDRFNIFQSTAEPFTIEYEGEWSENNQALKEVIIETYNNQGIKTKSTAIRKENIDGLTFEVYDISLIDPKGKVVITQTMYSSLINGYDFGANMTYNSDENRDVMLNAWRNSKFKK